MLRLLALAGLLAASAAAQVTEADLVGTWELTAVENLPFEDDLVFARMTFADGDLARTFVLLDPDDGELIGQVEADRYLVSDGQVIVRGGRDVTVWDVVRTPGGLVVGDLETGVVFRLRAADPAGALDPDLLGAWRFAAGEGGAAGLGLQFFADGTVEVQDGDDRDRVGYVVAGPYLLIGDEPSRYTFTREGGGARRLVLSGEGGAATFSHEADR